MRKKLNENPVYQLVAVAILLLAGGYMLSTRVLGGSSKETAAAPVTTVPTTDPAAATAGAVLSADPAAAAAAPAAAVSLSSIPLPPLPPKVVRAHELGNTIALLIVRGGAVSDQIVARSVRRLAREPGVAVFVITADRIARYAAITGGVGVDRVPALVIVSPGGGGGTAAATVQYGFQSPENVVQAVRDATYAGPTVGYAPG